MAEGQVVPGSIYIYAPNQGAPVFFAVAFFAAYLIQLWQCHRYKCWGLTWLFPFSLLLFAVGFALREWGAFHYLLLDIKIDRPVLNVYMASMLLIYMAPPILELANYHILGRVLYYVPWLAPMHPGRVLTSFGALAAVVEVLNAIGVTYGNNNALPLSYRNVGQILLEAGLILQLVVLSLFLYLITIFRQRLVKADITSKKVMRPLTVMYISTALIVVRTIYRTVEYFIFSSVTKDPTKTSIDLLQNPLLRYEWFFYVFEATLMLLNAMLWTWQHPRRYLPISNRIHLERDGVTEVEGAIEDNRNFWITLIDPFGWFLKGKEASSPQRVDEGYKA